MLDIVLSTVMLIGFAPILLLSSGFVLLVSSGPALIHQSRVGRDGTCFKMWKLRTMVADAEVDGVAMLAAHDDERVIRGGRLLRALHVDEFPQFVNVLRGDMSMVGPRPERPEFVTQLADFLHDYPHRHAVRPGLTGLAQIVGGYHMKPAKKLEFDLKYCAKPTSALYLAILVATPFAIIRDVVHAHGSAAPVHEASPTHPQLLPVRDPGLR